VKYIKTFESFEQPDGTGLDTFWETEVDGEKIRVTIKDIMNHLEDDVEIDPNEIKNLLIDVERDPIRVENADLSYPIIIAKSGDEFVSILDGQHRVVKALRDDVGVKARILDLDMVPESWKKIFIR
jgi:hypothetical protein